MPDPSPDTPLDGTVLIPKDPEARARLAEMAGLTPEERDAVERWLEREGDRPMASPDTPSVCPTSNKTTPFEAWAKRNGARTTCPQCGQRVTIHMRRMDWTGREDTYLEAHDAPATPAALGSSSPDTAALVARLRGAASMFAEDPDGTAWVVTPDTTLLADLRAAADALESLTRWKAEAVDVMDDWLNVWKALGSPGVLGESIAHASEHEVAKLTAERDALRADR